jgi:hypothetical protein
MLAVLRTNLILAALVAFVVWFTFPLSIFVWHCLVDRVCR